MFFYRKVHILRITHFSETTTDRNLIFDMSIWSCAFNMFYPRGSAPPSWGICLKICDQDPHPKPYIFMIRVTRQIKCIIAQAPGSYPTLLMISWIVFTLHTHVGKYFQSIIHAWLVYSLVSYLFIKQDQMILTCNSAVASLMLSRFLKFLHHVSFSWYSTRTNSSIQ